MYEQLTKCTPIFLKSIFKGEKHVTFPPLRPTRLLRLGYSIMLIVNLTNIIPVCIVGKCPHGLSIAHAPNDAT